MNSSEEPRLNQLVSRFREIGEQHMRDLPLYNPQLEVEAVDFVRQGEDWLGVLITPWFMNLMILPHTPVEMNTQTIGHKVWYELPAGRYAFLDSGDEHIGRYYSLSLHSPMAAFQDQDAARAEAEQRLRAFMQAPAESSPAPEKPSRPALSRRDLLRGRSA